MFGAFWAILGLFEVILWAFLVSFPILPFAVLPRGKRERFTIVGAQIFGWLCIYVTCLGRTTIRGVENLPKKSGYLVISNHRSWADVGMLVYHTRSQGISKKEVAWIPFFGLNGYLSGVIFFDRKNRMSRGRVIEEAKLLLTSGANLHVFPEGTRTRDGRLRKQVHLRLVQVAWENGIDVVPAAVWGTERAVAATGVYAMPFQKFGLDIAAPLDRAAFASGEDYAEASWARVVEMCRENGADEPFASAG